MAKNYDLITSQSSIQVLSPTVVQPVVDATIVTKPSGIVADYWLDEADWKAGTAPALLETFAGNIEHIVATGKVIGGSGSQSLDANGLLQQWVTFIVAYQVPGSPGGPATVDVDVPVGDLGGTSEFGTNYGMDAALKLIDDEYAKLVALAQG